MNNQLKINKLIVKPSSIHGLGVFADTDIQAGEIIEECYTLVASDDPELNHYLFSWEDSKKHAIPLGFGCIYNHAEDPNARHESDYQLRIMTIKANRFIPKGEEIFISYGKYWFDSRNMPMKKLSLFRKSWRFLKGMPLRAAIIGTAILFALYFLRFLIATQLPQ